MKQRNYAETDFKIDGIDLILQKIVSILMG